MKLFNLMSKIFKRKPRFDFAAPDLKRTELQDIQKSYARLFASNDGQRVLDHLQKSTFWRVLPSDARGEDIRYVEGQRAIVAQILRHIMAGRQPN